MAEALTSGRRTVVVGGGVAGLLAAIAVARHSAEVIVVERDIPPDDALPRKSVPQGHHVHTLLLGGRTAIETLCPGVHREILAAGAQPIDFCADVAFFHHGVWKSRCRSEFLGTLQTRPLLERILWGRVQSLGNVAIWTGVAQRLVATADGRRVVGVEVVDPRGMARVLLGDIVIDASGRGSRLPAWLAELGLAPPVEETIRFDLRYASCLCRLRDDARRDWRALLVYPKAPFGRRAGYIFPVEGGRHLVTLAGYFGEAPRPDFGDFLTFARTLPRRELYDAIADAEPLSKIRLFHLAAQRRRRYDLLRHMPEGLIALGDAVCVLDPLFGQGMTVAARQALALGDFFAHQSSRVGRGAWSALERQIVRQTNLPWLLTSSEAFRYADAEGRRSPLFRPLQWYAAKVFELSASDPRVYRAFMGLMHLVEPLSSVFRPRLALAVLRQALRSSRRRLALPGAIPIARPAE
ncbi:MAG TPA: FAD-binding protein [Stellaceae bacterium]|jgi:flavin-dependent dehydrogenase|nr:FAD-binding protein [Stellaceae bacterium]